MRNSKHRVKELHKQGVLDCRDFQIVHSLPKADDVPLHPVWIVKHQRVQNKGYYHAITKLHDEIWCAVMVTDGSHTWRTTLAKLRDGNPNAIHNYTKLCNWDLTSTDEWNELWTRICERPLEVLTVSVL